MADPVEQSAAAAAPPEPDEPVEPSWPARPGAPAEPGEPRPAPAEPSAAPAGSGESPPEQTPAPPAARTRVVLPSPFTLGFAAAIGVLIAYLLFRTLLRAEDVVVLVGLSLFLAAGMDPLVRFGQRVGLRRGLAVGVVFLGVAAVFTGFGFAVVPPLVDQITGFVHHLPDYLDDLQHNSRIANLDRRFHLIARARDYVTSGALLRREQGNVLHAGTTVATIVFEGVSVLVLTLYFMAYFDQITEFAYRMVPRSRRPRAQDIGTKITGQVGEYVAGNLLMGLSAGVFAGLWLWAIGAPYPIALAFVVALFDLVPLIGAPIAAAVVTIIVMITSVGWGIATLGFFIAYQLAENLWLQPRVFSNRVHINPVVTIVGALVGATLLGVIGFLLAIPLVAMIDLILREVVVPRQQER